MVVIYRRRSVLKKEKTADGRSPAERRETRSELGCRLNCQDSHRTSLIQHGTFLFIITTMLAIFALYSEPHNGFYCHEQDDASCPPRALFSLLSLMSASSPYIRILHPHSPRSRLLSVPLSRTPAARTPSVRLPPYLPCLRFPVTSIEPFTLSLRSQLSPRDASPTALYQR